jgi:hypothetical protein
VPLSYLVHFIVILADDEAFEATSSNIEEPENLSMRGSTKMELAIPPPISQPGDSQTDFWVSVLNQIFLERDLSAQRGFGFFHHRSWLTVLTVFSRL